MRTTEQMLGRWLSAVAGVALLGSLATGYIWGLPAFLLGMAGLALSLCIGLMWSSLQEVGRDGDMSFEQALSLAAPSQEEEQKRAVLRTLKDLEYELAVGKISRKDYDEVSTEMRARAKKLIAVQDESMKHTLLLAELRVQQHLRNSSGKPSSPPSAPAVETPEEDPTQHSRQDKGSDAPPAALSKARLSPEEAP